MAWLYTRNLTNERTDDRQIALIQTQKTDSTTIKPIRSQASARMFQPSGAINDLSILRIAGCRYLRRRVNITNSCPIPWKPPVAHDDLEAFAILWHTAGQPSLATKQSPYPIAISRLFSFRSFHVTNAPCSSSHCVS